jgi:quercetin dioxygenase-like cupin family protein
MSPRDVSVATVDGRGGQAPPPHVVPPGGGERLWFLTMATDVKATGRETGGAYTLLENRYPAGFVTPLHVHEREQEAFYLLDGEITFESGGHSVVAEPGTFLVLPRRVPHRFSVSERGPARMLVLASPPGIEAFFREAGRAAEGDGLPPGNVTDVARLGVISSRYGSDIL